MPCDICCREGVFWSFSENLYRCKYCKKSLKADIKLWDALHTGWTVTFTQTVDKMNSYVLRWQGIYIGTITDYLGGVAHLEGPIDGEISKQKLATILEALYFCFDVYNLLPKGGKMLTYYPKLD